MRRGKGWSYVLYLGRDATGRKRQKWVGGFPTRKDAETGLTEALHRLQTGAWADPGRQTVGEFVETWLEAVQPSVAPVTWAGYRTVLNRWVLPHLGSIRLSALTVAQLNRLYAKLLQGGARGARPCRPGRFGWPTRCWAG